MKPPLRSIAALFAACGLVSAADSTHELRDSLLARGDFNGDGRADLAVVDRVTGLVRIAHAQVGGALVWSETHHTGIAPATGVAIGKFLVTTRDALAVTSTTANRTNIFNLSNPASVPVPLSVFTPATGPTGVAAAQVANGTTLEEIEHITAIARSGGGWNLLVVFEAGWAQLFSFDGQSAPVPGKVFPVPADGSFLGAFASGPGDFHLLAGPPGMPLARAHRFTWDGTSHAPNGISDLPPLRSNRPATNVFAFNDDPFIATDAVPLGSFSAGEWTREGRIVGDAIEAAQSRFANPTSGLGDFSGVNLDPRPPDTTYVMTNEIPSFQAGIPSYASAYGPTRALGRTIGEVTITPTPGRMLRSIRPTFTAPPAVTVFWRICGGGWVSLAAQPPGWQFQEFTI
jgi:hypothetical protein